MTAVAVRRKLLADVQAIPGVVAAARVNSRLFGTTAAQLHVDGIDSVEVLGRFNMQIATPDYFRVMRTGIVRGRAFTDADRGGGPLVAVVSDAMARALWPNKDPLGQCVHIGIGASASAATAPCTTVIGIAENTAQQNITDDPRFMYYLPVDQIVPHLLSTTYVRMSHSDVRGDLERVRRAVTHAMPATASWSFIRCRTGSTIRAGRGGWPRRCSWRSADWRLWWRSSGCTVW